MRIITLITVLLYFGLTANAQQDSSMFILGANARLLKLSNSGTIIAQRSGDIIKLGVDTNNTIASLYKAKKDSLALTNAIGAKDLRDSVSFVGYWFKSIKNSLTTYTTLNQGNSISFNVAHTQAVSIKTNTTSASTDPPIIGVSIDGGAYTFFRTIAGVSNLNIATGLDSSKAHTITLVTRGISQNFTKWDYGENGFGISGITLGVNGTFSTMPLCYKIMVHGDSIADGVDIHYATGGDGVEGSAASGDGIQAWPQGLAKSLNEGVIMHGFGGTGLNSAGAGNVPRLIDNIGYYYSGVQAPIFSNVDKHFLYIGTNYYNVTQANFGLYYDSVLTYYQSRYINQEIIPIIPMYFVNIPTARDSIKTSAKRHGLNYVDCTTADYSAVTLNGLHPDSAGSITLAALIARDYKALHGSLYQNSLNFKDSIQTATTNLNNFLTNGIFRLEDGTNTTLANNFPVANVGGTLTVVADPIYGQFYQTYQSRTADNSLYIRNYWSSFGWYPWVRVNIGSAITAASYSSPNWATNNSIPYVNSSGSLTTTNSILQTVGISSINLAGNDANLVDLNITNSNSPNSWLTLGAAGTNGNGITNVPNNSQIEARSGLVIDAYAGNIFFQQGRNNVGGVTTTGFYGNYILTPSVGQGNTIATLDNSGSLGYAAKIPITNLDTTTNPAHVASQAWVTAHTTAPLTFPNGALTDSVVTELGGATRKIAPLATSLKGISPIVKNVSAGANANATSTINTFAAGASGGQFIISNSILVVSGTGYVTVTATYTDTRGNARSITFYNMGATSSSITAFSSYPVLGEISVQANSVINVIATITGVTSYDYTSTITQLN